MVERSEPDKYEQFRDWTKRKGILGQDRVDYPHMFGEGSSKYPGFIAIRDIKH